MPLTYDVHTHIGADLGFLLRGWWPYASTAQDLLERMNANGIDRAVCFPFCLSTAYDPYAFVEKDAIQLLPGRFPYDKENPLLIQEIEWIDLDRRLRVLAMVDPSRAVAQQLAALERMADRIAGLKIQATVIQSFVKDFLDLGRPIMELAEAKRWPVLIHTSYNKDDCWSQSSDCLKVAQAFPKARFNLAHSLRFDLAMLKEAARTPNVWVDCSAHLIHCEGTVNDMGFTAPRGERVDADYSRPDQVLLAIHDLLGSRYMWGSDNPFMSWCDDGMRMVQTYAAEVNAVRMLPPRVQHDLLTVGPESWLLDR
ncbi:MAG: amidohydrolase family protein [Phycisphaeraceae bacterium]|nr:amidohydrolase family protein [Phycisphaeraceae bacterium]